MLPETERCRMRAFIRRNKYRAAAAVLVLGLWWILSRIYSPLVVPPISSVVRGILAILSDKAMWKAVFETVFRMFAGLGLGVLSGIAAGLLGGLWRPFRLVWEPIRGIIQVVPPISWLILAIIWFGYNGRASIFIVVMAVMPSITICVEDGIDSIDRKLVDMGRVFRFSKWKMLSCVFVPSVLPFFYSGLKIAVGTACKTVVMGEVLTTTTGIGGQITTARLNIEPETVIAWTVIVVMIYYVTVLAGRIALGLIRKARRERSRRHRRDGAAAAGRADLTGKGRTGTEEEDAAYAEGQQCFQKL